MGLLSAHCRGAVAESIPVGRHASNGDDLGLEPLYELDQAGTTNPKLLPVDLRGPGGGSPDEIGDPDANSGELFALAVSHPDVAVDGPVDETGALQRRIEAVGGVAEVSLGRRSPQTRVDAYEKKPAVIFDEVGDGDAPKRLELRLGETQGLLLLALVVGIVPGSVVGDVDDLAQLGYRLQQDALYPLLQRHLGKAATLAPAK